MQTKILLKCFKYACKKFYYIIIITPYIKDKFLKINKNSCEINNFPILGELLSNISWKKKIKFIKG